MSPPSKRARVAGDRLPTVRLQSPDDSQRQYASESQQMRILSAVTRVVSEQGVESVTVARVIDLAGVSRRTFNELFDDSSDCLLQAIEEVVALAAQRAAAAYGEERRWVERVRAGLFAGA